MATATKNQVLTIVVESRGHSINDVEPTLVSAIVAQVEHKVVLVSQGQRQDLQGLAQLYSVPYRFGDTVMQDYDQTPTLVLRPGQVIDPEYLHKVISKGIPQGVFYLPTNVGGVNTSAPSGLGKLMAWFNPNARRSYERAITRQKVSMKASVGGVIGRCVDIHQAGGGFLLPKSNLALDQKVDVWVECHTVSGEVANANGKFTVKNIRTATPSGETWRVGGVIEWNTPGDLTRVIEDAFVVEKFMQPNNARSGGRAPVSIHSTVSGINAECIELSKEGAAFVLKKPADRMEGEVKVELHLTNGQNMVGTLLIMNQKTQGDTLRLGGTMTWESQRWLVDNTRLLYSGGR